MPTGTFPEVVGKRPLDFQQAEHHTSQPLDGEWVRRY
jgi:hypothetical protein